MPKLTSSFSINTSTLSSLPSRMTSFPTHSSAMASFESNNQEASSSIVEPDQNVLQKHAAFFDRNQDGVVYPWETFRGFRAIGCGVFLSAAFSIFINLTLSQKTRPGKCPSLLLPIEVRNIQRAKHGSDTGVYDSQGRFVALKFEEIFRKHARSHPDALTSHELDAMLKANRVPKDYSGWVGAYAEWKLLYYLCKDKNGLLHKDTVKAVYDGTLFHQMEKDHSSRSTL